jgi:D-sedoheptulose 7-phosphate isomerase
LKRSATASLTWMPDWRIDAAMESVIDRILRDSLDVKERSIRAGRRQLEQIADRMAAVLASGHKILIFGNGGSAADAQHLAAEFVNRFQIERPPLAALALTTDSSILTSIGNDYDFRDVFAKQVKALGRPDDMAVGISTSGGSPNVLDGIAAARQMGMTTVGMTGQGGPLAQCCAFVLAVDSSVTARIQETHITMGHILCELVDRILYPASAASGPEDPTSVSC